MSKTQKLLDKVKDISPNIRLDEAMKVARLIGFVNEGGSGSHTTMSREGEPTQLNFQARKDGKAKPYQIRQLKEMLLKYEDELND